MTHDGRRFVVAAFSVVVACAAGAARAQEDQTWGPDLSRPPPLRFMAELKFGMYSPNIDATSSLTGKPFADLFRSQTSPDLGRQPAGKLLTTIEFDWEFFHGFGSLGVGASVGYSRRTTHGFNYGPNFTSCVVPDCVRSGDSTALNVIPFTLELIYRFDELASRFHIPLVPYVKGGFGYYFWFIQDGSGGIASVPNHPNESGIGGTLGLVAHPGLALVLDFLQPDSAITLDHEAGIVHSYLFFEMNAAWITGLGFSNKMVFSDVGWNAGIAFEF